MVLILILLQNKYYSSHLRSLLLIPRCFLHIFHANKVNTAFPSDIRRMNDHIPLLIYKRKAFTFGIRRRNIYPVMQERRLY